jgi:hypothetical protein
VLGKASQPRIPRKKGIVHGDEDTPIGRRRLMPTSLPISPIHQDTTVNPSVEKQWVYRVLKPSTTTRSRTTRSARMTRMMLGSMIAGQQCRGGEM